MKSASSSRRKAPAKKRPFIDFYTQLNVIPTTQNIRDLKAHFDRRRGLYIQLGIPPLFVKGRTVLEFGPGTGQNALFTASLEPAQFTLVDGNRKSIETTTQVLAPYRKRVPLRIVASDILEFRSRKKFDLVLCEGLIPTQLDPAGFLRHVCSFTAPGGVAVATCMDSVSLLSEVLRRYLAYYECPQDRPVQERIAKLTKFFKPHFDALPGMSRRHDEWVIDNIIHPWSGPLFSIAEALGAVKGKMVVLGASPRSLLDWRWYKKIMKDEVPSLAGAEESFWQNLHSFIDHRFVLPPREVKSNQRLARKADQIFRAIHEQERTGKTYAMATLARDLREIDRLIDLPKSRVHLALNEYCRALETYRGSWPRMPQFAALWGRGQQYLSFVRL
jgi:SAM-dependent methyltransferase